MKILHIVQGYHPVVGGSEWLVKNLSEQLVSRYHDEVTVFTAAATRPAYFWRAEGEAMPSGVENINGVTVRRFKVFHRLRLLRMLLAHTFHRLRLPYHDWARTIQVGPLIFDMPKAIAQSGADVIFATAFPFMHMYYAVAGARRAGIPVVLLGSIHAEDTWGYERKMMLQAIHKADAYVALTSFERDYLVERGVAVAKIEVIGAGVDAARFAVADGTAVRQQYGFGADPVIIVMTRQSELKRLDTIIKAMPEVWSVYPNTHLLMAGARTNYSVQLDRMIAALTPEQQKMIRQVHNFPESEKPMLLAAADLFVHTSGNESFGIAFVEAWAAGRAVIGARVGAVSSLVDEEVDGLLFEYGHAGSLARAILRLLPDPERREQLGAAGRQKVLANYTWETISDRLRALYAEVVRRNSI